MRHSTIDLTMSTYTDPRLLDVAGALEALPALPLGAEDGHFDSARIAASSCPVNENDPLTLAVNGPPEVERRRVELPTSALRTQRSPN